jgi:hypothetical protein
LHVLLAVEVAGSATTYTAEDVGGHVGWLLVVRLVSLSDSTVKEGWAQSQTVIHSK